jgi:hypothetical protein
VQHETVRSVRAGRLDAAPPAGRVRVIPFGLVTGLVMAVALMATEGWWTPPLIGEHSPGSAALIAVGAVAFAGLAAFVGAFTGLGRWSLVGGLNAADGVARAAFITLAVILASSGDRLAWMKIASISGAGVWLVFLAFSRRTRAAAALRGDVSPRAYAPLMAQTVLAGAASFSLVVGYPTVLALMLPRDQIEAAAGLIFAVTMTRAPLMMPINAFQGMVVAKFVDPATGRMRLLAILVGALAVAGAAVAAVIAWIGPWLLAFLRPDYQVGAGVLAGLTGAAAMLGLVSLTGSVALAMKRHGPYLAGWALAIGITIAILATDLPLATRIIASLVAGPGAGAAIHAWAILSATRSAR